jgi:hypothetical protein
LIRAKEDETEMEVAMKATETAGTVDIQRQLVLDELLPIIGPTWAVSSSCYLKKLT